MIAVDTNLLVYAHREDAQWHEAAYSCIAGLAEGLGPWTIPWPCIHEFIAIVTHPRIYSPPTTIDRAIEQVEAWLESPSLVLLSETEDYWPQIRSILMSSRISGPMVHDSRVAALCVLHGITELWTADRDFSRFTGVQVKNPLVRLG